MSIIQKFRDSAVEVYNEKSKSNCKDFAELQSKLIKCTDVLCEDQYFGIVRIEKSIPSFCEWVIPPVFLKSKVINEREKEKLDLKNERQENEKKIKKYIADNFLKTIVIVLESPHTDEFLKKNKERLAIGPACGETGEHLYWWLPEVMLKYLPFLVDKVTKKVKYYSIKDIESGVYVIKLVNAIQFQCSLGENTEPSKKTKEKDKCYRDKVFAKMWDSAEVIESFIKRIKDARPNIIINCCTRGNLGKKCGTLRDRVQKELNAKSKNLSCLLLRAAHPSGPQFKNGLSWLGEDEK